MALLNKESIRAVKDLVTEEVEVPLWGGSVLVRSLTGAERGRLEVSTMERKGVNYAENLSTLRARMVMLSVVDDQGKRMFSDKDIDFLNDKNASALEAIFQVAMRLSGITKTDVDELTQTLKNDQSASSSSSSL